jgi:glycerophosphoryl diester phosphodiesterase
MDRAHQTVFWALRQFRRSLRDVIACSLGFNLLNLFVFAPLVAGVIRLMLERWGRASVGNFEIATFLLSLPGLIAVVAAGSLFIAIHFLEFAALVRLLADRRLHWWSALGGATGVFHRLLELGARQLAVYLLLLVPFLAGIGVVYFSLWAGRDLNGLIILRPPVFWIGGGIAAVIAAVYALLALRIFLRWLFAVPIMLFERGVTPRNALKRSVELTRGRLWPLATTLAMWAFVMFLLGTTLAFLIKVMSEWVLNRADHSLTIALPITAALLVIHSALLTVTAAATSATFASLVFAMYQRSTGSEPPPLSSIILSPSSFNRRLSTRWLIPAGLIGLGLAMLLLSGWLVSDVTLKEPVEITAHRSGAHRAPENTVAAIRQAIADNADWAEIDVQLTADDRIVVMHDTDLARIGGGNRAVGDVTLAEIQALDVGTSFGPQFAGEKVPTFEDVLAAAGDKLRLNVELKPHGKADEMPLAERTVAAIRRAGAVKRCRICSQSFEAIQAARQLEPGIPIGFIAGAAVGDLAKLDVDFLMVKTDLAQRSLIDRASAHHIHVHAWTVNDANLVARLVDDGVANIITDDVPLIRARLEELRALNPTERLLLRARRELMR